MIPDSVGPLSRPLAVHSLPATGTHVVVKASPAECDLLAADLGLPGIDRLEARLHVRAVQDRIRVTGRVEADIRQTCVVSLDEFTSRLDEEVEVQFTAAGSRREPANDAGEFETDLDAPEELVGERIDLGAIAAEFLALGLDPYPRKPGVAFEQAGDDPDGASPFAALSALKTPENDP